MLDSQTYNLSSGEFKAVTDEFLALEAHAYRQFMTLPEELKDTYKELILFLFRPWQTFMRCIMRLL